ncbi:MAG: bifunctional phosphopantothenoylcysteine decarboxylase/phosphopantothenate--cysteine ligase CoaBC [bacterium]
MSFFGKKIVVGVSGGIAAYKSCELVRELRRRGAQVRVVMTPAARQFVGTVTFAALTEHDVLLDHLVVGNSGEIEHIQWSRWAEVIVVCPATANTIARLAHGFADEALSATIRATRAPVVICPSMNAAMWEDRLVQDNVRRLRDTGYGMVDPEFGALATAAEGEGWGRLARLDWILTEVLFALQPRHPLQGKKVLVTAGRTEEYFDPVRMLTNPATGKMGFALAEAAVALGAKETVLVHGPTHLPAPYRVKMVPVTSAAEMSQAAAVHYEGTDILAMSAAVSDYRPAAVASEKIKKLPGELTLALTSTEDILQSLGKRKTKALHVGFAVETENERQNAVDKLRRKNLDLIVLNNPKHEGAGFGTDTNRAVMIDRNHHVEELPMLPKLEVAFEIFQRVVALARI